MTTKVTRNMLDTSIVDNGNATALTIDANENLGLASRLSVGTTTVGGGNTKVVVTGSSDNYIQLVSSTGNGGISIGNSAGNNLLFYTHTGALGSESFTERMRLTSDGNLGIRWSAPTSRLGILQNGSNTAGMNITDGASADFLVYAGYVSGTTRIGSSAGHLAIQSAGTERARFDTSGNFLINRTSSGFNNDGTIIGNSSGSYMYMERSTGTVNSVLYLHRRNGDGQLITFYESNSAEGYIQVSGSTVSLVGFGGAHDSSGSGISSSTPVGTVLSTIDEEHKQNHAKVKVSDTEGDTRVYGVLQEYKAEEINDTGKASPQHAVVSAVGIGSVLVTGACNGGDLLESNGDGTAKVQDDDIIRSKTIGKVTIGNSDTDVKLVSCVLYCG